MRDRLRKISALRSHFIRFLPADAGARELFSAASSYAPVSDPNRARAARAACLCLLAARQPAEALDYALLAEQLEEGGDPPQLSVQTKFLKLKCGTNAVCTPPCLTCYACRIQLEQGVDDDAALVALQSFSQCADFDIDFLYLAALVRNFVFRASLLLTRGTHRSRRAKMLCAAPRRPTHFCIGR